jgi:hypothetical protein
MANIVITGHKDLTLGEKHKEILVFLTIDSKLHTVSVLPSCGEYEYGDELPAEFLDDDEPIQVAIGEYFDEHDVDVGVVGR